jgi:hypothetical protein
VNDDEIIAAHEAEFEADPPRRRSNRGFWMVAIALLLACVFLIVEIFVNRGVKDTIAHSQHSLRTAETAARELADGGSFADASAGALAGAERSLTYVGPATESDGLEVVSVSAAPEIWAAAVQVRPDACFYLKIQGDETTYGTGTLCTAEEALVKATDARW